MPTKGGIHRISSGFSRARFLLGGGRDGLARVWQFLEPESPKAVWYGWLAARDRCLYASVDTEFVGRKYLLCASQGLATVFRLPEGQFLTFAQPLGYPA